MQGCHKAWVGGRNYDLSLNFITVKSIRMNLKNCFPKWKVFLCSNLIECNPDCKIFELPNYKSLLSKEYINRWTQDVN